MAARVGTQLSTRLSTGEPARRRGLPPVVDANTRVLVLGSFPGVASLAARQYYAHPRNHFWPIMAAILDEPLTELPYTARLARMSARGIGLWDIIVACHRKGSGDAAIRNAERGDVRRIRRRRAFTCRRLLQRQYRGDARNRCGGKPATRRLRMPSTSPAYTRPFAEKLAGWRALERWLP